MRYVQEYARGEYEEKKSRFIGELFPIHSPEEAEEQIAAVRKKYYDARHHCYAYVLGEKDEIKKQSDDGEPSQTAGLPILSVLTGAEIHDALLVVTRYFGGTLLGTGGLVRAYTAAAKDAVENAVLMTAVQGYRASAELEYTLVGKLKYAAEKLGIREESCDYQEKVKAVWLVPEDSLPAFQKQVQALSLGSVTLAIEKARWYNL